MRRKLLVIKVLTTALLNLTAILSANGDVIKEIMPRCYNEYDENGLKTGFWVHPIGVCQDSIIPYLRISIYQNGKLTGPELAYTGYFSHKCIIPDFITNYENDSLSGFEISMDKVVPRGIATKIGPLKDFSTINSMYYNADSLMIYQSFDRVYYTDGKLESVGWSMSGEDFIIDCDYAGIIQLYDRNGNVRFDDYRRRDLSDPTGLRPAIDTLAVQTTEDTVIKYQTVPPELSGLFPSTTNQLDSRGRKTGFWLNINEDGISVTTYHGGIKDGLKWFYSAQTLAQSHPSPDLMINYDSGSISEFILFMSNHLPKRVISKIGPNTDYSTDNPKLKYQGYERNYDYRGRVTSHGWAIFGENFETDYLPVGIWER